MGHSQTGRLVRYTHRSFPSPLWLMIGVLCGFPQGVLSGTEPDGIFVGELEAGREITLKAARCIYALNVVEGFEWDRSSQKISLVLGEQRNDGEWILTVFSAPGQVSGTFRGSPGLQRFQGTWRSHDIGTAVPVRFRRLEIERPYTTDEFQQKSEDFVERALDSAVAGDFRVAQYYLRLYHATNKWVPYTKDWEDFFEAELTGAEEAYFRKEHRTEPDITSSAPVAYLLARRGGTAEAKRIYQAQCRMGLGDPRVGAFTCLMYASLSEKTGDRPAMLEGYDFACGKLAFPCRKAFGPAEEQLMTHIAKRDSVAALADLQQPNLNVNARQGKALQDAVKAQLKDVVKALLAYGADPNRNYDIVHSAGEGKDVAILRLLQAYGAKRDYQGATCPQEPELEVAPSSEHWLEGAIGKRRVRMYLNRGGEAVVGAFYDVADWVPLILRGRWADDDAIEVTASAAEERQTGKLKGSVSATGLVGTWTPEDGSPAQGVRLQRSSADSCDGNGPWRQFSDARWPITFSYPASWHLEATSDGVSITCPDPSLLVYEDFYIRVTQAAKEDRSLVQCGKKWYFGECDCKDASDCQEADVNSRDGMTIVRDEAGGRVYCKGGGYVGLGDGAFVWVVIGRRWVTFSGMGSPSDLIQRILSTVKERR